MNAPPRRILLADADAFFVAVARMEDPDGVGRAPLLIVGGTRASRGVVCSASYETRAYGVRSAMPIARALRLCPDAVCVPVPRKACAQKSGEIRQVLERFAPVVEAASIDEWYLDLAGTEALYRQEPLATTAHRMRDAIRRDTGLHVSFGGGTSKLVAKLAVERAKPKAGHDADGVYVVPAGGEATFLHGVPLADIPMIGPRFQERLVRFGMHTVPDVLAYDEAALAHWLGAREARWLYERVRGIDDRDVAPRLDTKSISRDETFPEDLTDDGALGHELLALVTRAAADLRAEGLRARTVTVRIRDHDFRTRSASRTVEQGVISDRVILALARSLLSRLRAGRRVPARLLSVALSSLAEDETADQLALFDGDRDPVAETDRDRAVARAVDRVRAKFGPRGIGPGGV
ncbi:MAG: DNA polymerase IV [Gemmatimonadaceae bacterium]|nr:DNA polymerase IV [Gemmatimonadaceae bacterium]